MGEGGKIPVNPPIVGDRSNEGSEEAESGPSSSFEQSPREGRDQLIRRFPFLGPFIVRLCNKLEIYPSLIAPNGWISLMCLLGICKIHNRELTLRLFCHLYGVKRNRDTVYLTARSRGFSVPRTKSSHKGWDYYPIGCQLPSGRWAVPTNPDLEVCRVDLKKICLSSDEEATKKILGERIPELEFNSFIAENRANLVGVSDTVVPPQGDPQTELWIEPKMGKPSAREVLKRSLKATESSSEKKGKGIAPGPAPKRKKSGQISEMTAPVSGREEKKVLLEVRGEGIGRDPANPVPVESSPAGTEASEAKKAAETEAGTSARSKKWDDHEHLKKIQEQEESMGFTSSRSLGDPEFQARLAKMMEIPDLVGDVGETALVEI